jgi:signal transduction histidine kinase
VGDNLRFLKEAFADILRLVTAMRPATERRSRSAAMRSRWTSCARRCQGRGRLPGRGGPGGDHRQGHAPLRHPDLDERKLFDVNQAIENTLVVAKNEWKYVADVRLALASELPAVNGYPGEFNQIILNIVVNAAQAIAEVERPEGEKGVIDIATRRLGDEVEICIGDTGPGIPEEYRSRIFDPFFTTKEVGKGTGQGLAIVYAAVTKHDGTIDVTSELGKGTTFVIRLPAATGTPGLST